MVEELPLSPPLRFGMVNPGIYRGAYPVLPNFRFLYSLVLKTIISLTPEPPTEDLRSFAENAGIVLVHYPISRTGPLSSELYGQLQQSLQYCLDSTNFPIYVHCLDGRRITSIFVLLLRKLQAWSPIFAFTEYWRYQVTFKALQPMAEIEKTTKDLEKFCSESMEIIVGDNVPTWLYGGDRPTNISGMKVKFPASIVSPSNTLAISSGSTANNNSNITNITNTTNNSASNNSSALIVLAPGSTSLNNTVTASNSLSGNSINNNIT